MKNKEPQITEALKKSNEMLLEKKKKLGQKMVISENGIIKIIDFSKEKRQ